MVDDQAQEGRDGQEARQAVLEARRARSSSRRSEGGGDPEANIALANAIAKAKSYSLPKDNIERAIARGAGAGEGDAYEPVTYEGYGPGGAAFMIEALTDNRNRTAADVRAAFSKAGGALGSRARSPGCSTATA